MNLGPIGPHEPGPHEFGPHESEPHESEPHESEPHESGPMTLELGDLDLGRWTWKSGPGNLDLEIWTWGSWTRRSVPWIWAYLPTQVFRLFPGRRSATVRASLQARAQPSSCAAACGIALQFQRGAVVRRPFQL